MLKGKKRGIRREFRLNKQQDCEARGLIKYACARMALLCMMVVQRRWHLGLERVR